MKKQHLKTDLDLSLFKFPGNIKTLKLQSQDCFFYPHMQIDILNVRSLSDSNKHLIYTLSRKSEFLKHLSGCLPLCC